MAPDRIEGTSQFGANGNTGIAAHRDGFFRALRHVKVGDVLQVELPEATLTYKIASTRVVDPSGNERAGPDGRADDHVGDVLSLLFRRLSTAAIHRTRHARLEPEKIRLTRARR